jgi:hypothetical protein
MNAEAGMALFKRPQCRHGNIGVIGAQLYFALSLDRVFTVSKLGALIA